MHMWKAIFSILTVVFAAVGLMKLLPYDISLPVMFGFMGLSMLAYAKECYQKGSKRDTAIFGGIAVFIYVVTAYNILSRI